ncbi:MAG: hypothetical protein IJ764_02135 [Bacteroidales bacterium]|nr:hypothetical protein [Bacteroidales bacterium]
MRKGLLIVLFCSVYGYCCADKHDDLRREIYDDLSYIYELPEYNEWVRSLQNDDTMKWVRNAFADMSIWGVPEYDVLRFDLGLSDCRPSDEEINDRYMQRTRKLYDIIRTKAYIPSYNYFVSILCDKEVDDDGDVVDKNWNDLTVLLYRLGYVTSENRLKCDLGVCNPDEYRNHRNDSLLFDFFGLIPKYKHDTICIRKQLFGETYVKDAPYPKVTKSKEEYKHENAWWEIVIAIVCMGGVLFPIIWGIASIIYEELKKR